MIENHDSPPSRHDDVLDELEAEPGESVSVGNHKFLETSRTGCVQNFEEVLSFEVEAGSDVAEYFVVGVEFLQAGFLPLEVFLLGDGRDSAVDDSVFAFFLLLCSKDILAAAESFPSVVNTRNGLVPVQELFCVVSPSSSCRQSRFEVSFFLPVEDGVSCHPTKEGSLSS